MLSILSKLKHAKRRATYKIRKLKKHIKSRLRLRMSRLVLLFNPYVDEVLDTLASVERIEEAWEVVKNALRGIDPIDSIEGIEIAKLREKLIKSIVYEYPNLGVMQWTANGLAEGYRACCIEFFVRCCLLGERPRKMGGEPDPVVDGYMRCPCCARELYISQRGDHALKHDPLGVRMQRAHERTRENLENIYPVVSCTCGEDSSIEAQKDREESEDIGDR